MLRVIGKITTILLLMGLFGPSTTFAQTPLPAELIPFWNDREASSRMRVDHTRWQEILTSYLDDQHPSGINRFNYAAVTQVDRRKLNAYLQYLQALEPRQYNDNEQKAYWINLYNAMAVALVVNDGRDLRSIRQIRAGVFTPGPWSRKDLNVVSQDLSLDDIKNGILRPIWNDARVHYALNSASLGCPNLSKTAFDGGNIETLLDGAARAYINHARAVSVSSGQLTLSQIYEWYNTDFGNSYVEMINHISQFAEPALAESLKASLRVSYNYDWTLNRP
ncbi:MAG: DUF547 domain-containing protein [Pseudomonadota bacterium]